MTDLTAALAAERAWDAWRAAVTELAGAMSVTVRHAGDEPPSVDAWRHVAELTRQADAMWEQVLSADRDEGPGTGLATRGGAVGP